MKRSSDIARAGVNRGQNKKEPRLTMRPPSAMIPTSNVIPAHDVIPAHYVIPAQAHSCPGKN